METQFFVLLVLLAKPRVSADDISKALEDIFPRTYTGNVRQDLRFLLHDKYIGSTSKGEIILTPAGLQHLLEDPQIKIAVRVAQQIQIFIVGQTTVLSDFYEPGTQQAVVSSLQKLVGLGILVDDRPGEEPDVSDDLCGSAADPLADFRN